MKRDWLRGLLGWGFLALGVLTIPTAVARRMYIPSASMMPTLMKGDQLIVSKYPYGWSTASFPIHGTWLAPGRLLGKLPARGDIVTVVRRSDGEDLIKRVIGLPGDIVEVSHGRVILNGTMVPRVAVPGAEIPADANVPCDAAPLLRFRRPGPDGKPGCYLPVFRETLPNGASYDTIDLGDWNIGDGYVSPGDEFGPITVPAGHLFLMGDNRDQSADSRFPLAEGGLGGPVPFESISGRAELITHSYSGEGSWLNPAAYFTAMRSGRSWVGLRPAHR